jgi:hypothetical protein
MTSDMTSDIMEQYKFTHAEMSVNDGMVESMSIEKPENQLCAKQKRGP